MGHVKVCILVQKNHFPIQPLINVTLWSEFDKLCRTIATVYIFFVCLLEYLFFFIYKMDEFVYLFLTYYLS